MSQIKIYYRGDKEVEETYILKAVTYEVSANGVALATFCKPKKLNALTQTLILEICMIIEHAKRDPQCKILVWTGQGRAFSSGASFGAASKVDKEIIEGYSKHGKGPFPGDLALKSMVMSMLQFPKISICAVNGLAVGGSANFALAGLHDLVYASESAKFQYPFVSLGITPEVFSSYFLPRAMGMVTAKEIFFTGRWFYPDEAKKCGLINEVTSDQELMKKVMDKANELASLSQTSLQLTKRVINSHILEPKNANEVMDEENRTIAYAMKQPDFMKAVAAFMKKFNRKKSKL